VGAVDTSSGRWTLFTTDGRQKAFFFGNPGDVPFMGDWNCDGTDTPGLYRQSDGFVYLRNSSTAGPADVSFFYGNPGDVPLAGDWDGDGCDTVALYRLSTGAMYIRNALGTGTADFSYFFGNPGDVPFVGDFDGDGVDEVGLHRASTGFVYMRMNHSSGMADAAFFYGDPGDRIVSGDWDGDGDDTVGLYRASNQTFYLRNANSSGTAQLTLPGVGSSRSVAVEGLYGVLSGTEPIPPPVSGSQNVGVGVIFANDFNNDPLGTYTVQNLSADWRNPPWNNGVSQGRVSIVSDPDGRAGNSLRVFYPQGVFGPEGGGAQWKLDLGGSYEQLFLSYRVRFEPGFDFVRTGKLPGLCGGQCNTGGKKPTGTDGWSARQNWSEGGGANQYVYYPGQSGQFAERFDWNQNYPRGQWVLVEHRIVMNTPGQSNGIIQTWWNGQLALNRTNVRFRDIGSFAIEEFHFSTFFGGGDGSFAAARNEYTYFDDFVISTSPITH